MNSKNKQIAKDIFFRFDGSYFHMEREGELEKYKSLAVSDEQELAWAREYRDLLLLSFKASKLANDSYVRLVGFIRRSKSDCALWKFLCIVDDCKVDFDAFTKLRICEDLYELALCFNADSQIVKSTKSLAEKLLALLDSESVKIAPYYMDLSYMKNVLCEEYIIERKDALKSRLRY